MAHLMGLNTGYLVHSYRHILHALGRQLFWRRDTSSRHLGEVPMHETKRVTVTILLISGMVAGLIGQGCAATSRKIKVDSSAPAYVMPMANELTKQGISTEWNKPTDAGPTRSMSKPYQIFPTTYPATWTTKEIVHPGKGGYTGYFNQTGWAVANDNNDWADNIGRTWKQGHSYLDLYRVQKGILVKVTALDGTQPWTGHRPARDLPITCRTS
jgi:hypothetical protein